MSDIPTERTSGAPRESLPQVSATERRRRWRLVLGGAAEGIDDERDEEQPSSRPQPNSDEADGAGDPGGDPGGAESAGGQRSPGAIDGSGGSDAGGASGAQPGLAGDDARIDAALGALYDRDESGDRGTTGRRRSGKRAGGLGRSKPGVVRWLGDIRTYFPTPMVQIMQRDAIERLDLKQLLLEPELLQSVEPDIHMVTLLVELNSMLPEETRATARQVIAKVLAEIEARLVDQTRQAVRGALARSARTRRPRPGDIDWDHTIAANLQHWLPEYRTVVPERLIGHGRRQRSLANDVVIAVDQSGSMADSVVYASLFGGVLAQLPALRTRFIAFDTSVTDLTPYLHDPVEVLFGVQLGGGTDIANALGYCQQLIERPRHSVLFLVTDLFEGGNVDTMQRRVAEIVASGVHVVVLLALSDEGSPAHDHAQAAALTALGATVMATTPNEFPQVLADALA